MSILEYITRSEAKEIVAKIAKKGLPKPLVRLKFDQKIVVCVGRPGVTAETAFQSAVTTSPKHLVALPSGNTPFLADYTALTFPLYITQRGTVYIKQVAPGYRGSYNFTPDRFNAAYAASMEQAAIITSSQNKRRGKKRTEEE